MDASRVVAGCEMNVCLLLRGVLSATEEGGEEEDAALRGALDQVSHLLAQLRSAEGTEAEDAAAEARRSTRPQTAQRVARQPSLRFTALLTQSRGLQDCDARSCTHSCVPLCKCVAGDCACAKQARVF